MIKAILTILLVSTVLSSYSVSKARKYAYVCAATFATAEEIDNWSCKYCSEYKLTDVLLP